MRQEGKQENSEKNDYSVQYDLMDLRTLMEEKADTGKKGGQRNNATIKGKTAELFLLTNQDDDDDDEMNRVFFSLRYNRIGFCVSVAHLMLILVFGVFLARDTHFRWPLLIFLFCF